MPPTTLVTRHPSSEIVAPTCPSDKLLCVTVPRRAVGRRDTPDVVLVLVHLRPQPALPPGDHGAVGMQLTGPEGQMRERERERRKKKH